MINAVTRDLETGLLSAEHLNDANAVFEFDGIYHVMNQGSSGPAAAPVVLQAIIPLLVSNAFDRLLSIIGGFEQLDRCREHHPRRFYQSLLNQECLDAISICCVCVFGLFF